MKWILFCQQIVCCLSSVFCKWLQQLLQQDFLALLYNVVVRNHLILAITPVDHELSQAKLFLQEGFNIDIFKYFQKMVDHLSRLLSIEMGQFLVILCLLLTDSQQCQYQNLPHHNNKNLLRGIHFLGMVEALNQILPVNLS